MGIVALNHILGMNLEFRDIHHLYNIVYTREEGLTTSKPERKIGSWSCTHRILLGGDNDDVLVVTENWEERDDEGRLSGLHVPHVYGRPRESLSFPPTKFSFCSTSMFYLCSMVFAAQLQT